MYVYRTPDLITQPLAVHARVQGASTYITMITQPLAVHARVQGASTYITMIVFMIIMLSCCVKDALNSVEWLAVVCDEVHAIKVNIVLPFMSCDRILCHVIESHVIINYVIYISPFYVM